jgi:hypothetical protein
MRRSTNTELGKNIVGTQKAQSGSPQEMNGKRRRKEKKKKVRKREQRERELFDNKEQMRVRKAV